jgi:UDP-glucose 4-epimerase
MAILITGGLGFIGLNTARAVLAAGGSCVLTRYRRDRRPGFLADAGERAAVEQVDTGDLDALLAVGERHRITAIVHLAGAGLGGDDPVGDLEVNTAQLLNVVRAGLAWRVSRICVASSIGVYAGEPALPPPPWREDLPLSMTGRFPIEAMKKTYEVMASYLAGRTGLSLVTMRIAGIWGPYGRTTSPFIAAPALLSAAARGAAPDLSGMHGTPHADDGMDLLYARDCGRAVALLATAPRLRHVTYNVGAGRPTTNGELVAAIGTARPGWHVGLPAGHDPAGPGHATWLDTTRLRADTGFEPAYDTRRAVEDHLSWLTGEPTPAGGPAVSGGGS